MPKSELFTRAGSYRSSDVRFSVTDYLESETIVGGQRTVQAPRQQSPALAQNPNTWKRRIPQLSKRVTSNILLPLIIVVFTAIASVKHGPVRVYWSLGAFVVVALTGVINYGKDRTGATLRDATLRLRVEYATVLNDTGQPLITALGNVAAAGTPTDAKRELAVLVDRAVSLAQTEIARSSSSRTRAAFYCIKGAGLQRQVYHGWTGSDAPRREFVRDRSEHDNEVIRFAYGENALLVKDLENHPPPHFVDFRGRSYKSFVSVPVRAGNKSFGLLTADSDTAYALSEIERGFLILIAGALGAGMAHVEALESQRGSGQTQP